MAPTDNARDAKLLSAALGKCPRCGEGPLYKNFTEFRPACPVCKLDYDRFNVGDGAIVFLILILNTIGMVGALILEFSVHPPYWVQLVIWPPILIALTIIGLRGGKGLLMALEYRHDAREGTLGE